MSRNQITLNQLRRANSTRKAMFTNKHGELAHGPDTVPWNRAEWVEAMMGELGEYCNVSKKFRRGDLTKSEFIKAAMEEIGGTLLYLDLLCEEIERETGEPFDLAYAVVYEFNRKSAQIDVPLFIQDNGSMCSSGDVEKVMNQRLIGVCDEED